MAIPITIPIDDDRADLNASLAAASFPVDQEEASLPNRRNKVTFEEVYTFETLSQKLGLHLDLAPEKSIQLCRLLDLLEYLEQDSILNRLLISPRLSSLIQEKWNAENSLLILYSIFYWIAWASLNGYMLAAELNWPAILALWILAGISVAFLLVREILQMAASPRSYLLTFGNVPKFALVLLGLWVVWDVRNNPTSPIVILLSAWELALTICLWPTMFRTINHVKEVVRAILKAVVVYSVLFSAFGFVYFVLSNANFKRKWILICFVFVLFLILLASFVPVIHLVTGDIARGLENTKLNELVAMIGWIRYAQNIKCAAETVDFIKFY